MRIEYAKCVYCSGELRVALGVGYGSVQLPENDDKEVPTSTYPARCLTCGKINQVPSDLKVHSDG